MTQLYIVYITSTLPINVYLLCLYTINKNMESYVVYVDLNE